MPRNTGVSGRSTTWLIFRSPSPFTIRLCFSGVQIGLWTSLILILSAMVRDLVTFSRWAIPRILHFLDGDTAHLGHRALFAQRLQSHDGRLHHIVRIPAADRFRQHVRNAAGRNHRAHRAARDHAGTGWSRLEQYLAGCIFAQHLVRNRRVQHVNLAQALLGGLDTLADRARHFLRLADSVAYYFRRRIADHDQRGEAEVLTALHDLGDPVDRYYLLFQVERRRIDAFC